MFGGSSSGPWWQRNAVSPAVTATQTGPGTHNGIALDVMVLNNANITITGPQYQSSFAQGAVGSKNAAAPADVTIIPQYTGSSVYGAVNRNDAATVWTPTANTFFYQNAADATNTAAYGAFQLGASIVPVQMASNYGNSTSPLTVTFPNPTIAGNTVVVCVSANRYTTNPTVSGIKLGGAAGNFASVVALNNNGSPNCDSEIWYDPVCTGGQTSVTVSFNAGTGVNPQTFAAIYEVPAVLTADQTASNTSSTAGSTWTSGATPMTTSANEIWFGCAGGSQVLTPAGTAWITTDPGGSGNPMGYSVAAAEAAAAFTGTLSPAGVYTAVAATFSVSTSPLYTTAGTPVTIGATNGAGGAGADGGVAVVEVPPASGMTVSEDLSAPPAVWTASGISVTTAVFTPPMGSLLVAMIAAAGTNTGVTVTDTNGQLAWAELARWASGTSGYAGVWAAVVVCG